ncbi:DNA-directed RNA polymerase III subunit RPC7-like isoform X2 [Poecile atricapillus]|uniref:DNA-directed RNA polymerase III subunit RPC7-like isoform X2 n=1 Tax=Poecile atricapillus TaxID=48891 RepID=UPI002738E874|nr:DNA-directed RNA polymerase III subunit RPC7-like isoform X2 [Poecile atricapillus]
MGKRGWGSPCRRAEGPGASDIGGGREAAVLGFQNGRAGGRGAAALGAQHSGAGGQGDSSTGGAELPRGRGAWGVRAWGAKRPFESPVSQPAPPPRPSIYIALGPAPHVSHQSARGSRPSTTPSARGGAAAGGYTWGPTAHARGVSGAGGRHRDRGYEGGHRDRECHREDPGTGIETGGHWGEPSTLGAAPGAQHGGPGPRPGPGADDVQRGGRGDRQGGRAAPAHAAALAPLPDIERYSDKYQLSNPVDSAIDWNPDWRRLPRELKIRVRRLRKGRTAPLVPKQHVALDKEETIKKLEVAR